MSQERTGTSGRESSEQAWRNLSDKGPICSILTLEINLPSCGAVDHLSNSLSRESHSLWTDVERPKQLCLLRSTEKKFIYGVNTI